MLPSGSVNILHKLVIILKVLGVLKILGRSKTLLYGTLKLNDIFPTELGSSNDTFARTKNLRVGRGKGGPSIMDGPQAIARLIDRTGKDAVPQKIPGQCRFPIW